MTNRTNKFLSLFLALVLAFCTFGLTACGGSNADAEEQEQEQDNCYGDDMPVINED